MNESSLYSHRCHYRIHNLTSPSIQPNHAYDPTLFKGVIDVGISQLRDCKILITGHWKFRSPLIRLTFQQYPCKPRCDNILGNHGVKLCPNILRYKAAFENSELKRSWLFAQNWKIAISIKIVAEPRIQRHLEKQKSGVKWNFGRGD
jgi:hypothetical protein